MSSLKAFISKQRGEVGPHRQLSASPWQRLERREATAGLSPNLPKVPQGRNDCAAASSGDFEKVARFSGGFAPNQPDALARAACGTTPPPSTHNPRRNGDS